MRGTTGGGGEPTTGDGAQDTGTTDTGTMDAGQPDAGEDTGAADAGSAFRDVSADGPETGNGGVGDGEADGGKTCSDECAAAGTVECSGAYAYRVCGDRDGDGCLEWGSEQECAAGCADGKCGSCMPDCAGKDCGDDGCGEPCGQCSSPPASYCLDANRLRSYAAAGDCASGKCSYAYSDLNCQYGCAGVRCQSCPPSCGGRYCGEEDGYGGSCGPGSGCCERSCGGRRCGDSDGCWNTCEHGSGCCSNERYTRTSGAVSGGGAVCCDGNDPRVAIADCGTGSNHGINEDGSSCGSAWEGDGNGGSACVSIDCEKSTCW
ncbi:MAG: hypothetical protein HY897_06215 [Deltaproteobacteria bacterium]|nr:hypothetical protein [Deltaproteobacteria bacterium]